jgi:carbon storage regulator
MLVLTRKKGERVLIGDDIVVTLIDVRGDSVRIGFDAPRGVTIQRAEVLAAVSEANTEAAATGAGAGEVLIGLLGGAAPEIRGEQPAPQVLGDAPKAAPAVPRPTAPKPRR